MYPSMCDLEYWKGKEEVRGEICGLKREDDGCLVRASHASAHAELVQPRMRPGAGVKTPHSDATEDISHVKLTTTCQHFCSLVMTAYTLDI